MPRVSLYPRCKPKKELMFTNILLHASTTFIFFLLIFSNGSDASRKLSIVNYRLSIFLLAAFRQKKRTFFL